MKTLTKQFYKKALIFSLVLVCLGAGWWATRKSEAQNSHRVANFGMFGITAAQFARLNVTNACTPTEPCRTRTLRLIFVDANGSSGGGGVDSPLMQTTVTVEPGGSAFFDLPGSLFAGSGNRAQLRARVEDFGSPNGVPPNPIIPTLEVVDIATAETVFHIATYTSANGCGGSNPFF